MIKTIKQDLERLEAIDNANPSEALDKLEKVIEEITISNADLRNTLKTSFLIASVKQALLKAQEQKKALEIIKNKKVNMYHIWVFDNYQQYKEHYPFSEYHAIEDMLSENEFNLLKKVSENGNMD